jgi:hypothetical protein
MMPSLGPRLLIPGGRQERATERQKGSQAKNEGRWMLDVGSGKLSSTFYLRWSEASLTPRVLRTGCIEMCRPLLPGIPRVRIQAEMYASYLEIGRR